MYRLLKALRRISEVSCPIALMAVISTLFFVENDNASRPDASNPKTTNLIPNHVGTTGLVYGTPAIIEGQWRATGPEGDRKLWFVVTNINGQMCDPEVAFDSVQDIPNAKELRGLSAKDCRRLSSLKWKVLAWETIECSGIPFEATRDINRRALELGIDIPFRKKDPGFEVIRSLVIGDYLFIGDHEN